MSIHRIESAYAVCENRKDVNATAMAVLLALAYCENDRYENRCFPSDATLARMTHLNVATVLSARKRLRKAGLITWQSGGKRAGGNISNRYQFCFPQQKGNASRNVYAQGNAPEAPSPSSAGTSPSSAGTSPSSAGTLPVQNGNPTRPAQVTYPSSAGGLPVQRGSNTEENLKLKKEGNTEGKRPAAPPVRGGCKLLSSSVPTNQEGLAEWIATPTPGEPRRHDEPHRHETSVDNAVQYAMRLCNYPNANADEEEINQVRAEFHKRIARRPLGKVYGLLNKCNKEKNTGSKFEVYRLLDIIDQEITEIGR